MDTKTQNVGGDSQANRPEVTQSRRKRRDGDEANLRYFLPKAGSSSVKPELGQEMASESEALIEALKSGQPFYTLAAWRAATEVDGRSSPVIVKQVLART
jgi:hypothetical protein